MKTTMHRLLGLFERYRNRPFRCMYYGTNNHEGRCTNTFIYADSRRAGRSGFCSDECATLDEAYDRII